MSGDGLCRNGADGGSELARWARARGAHGIVFLVAATVPVMAFTLFFARYMPWMEAVKTAGQAVFNALHHSRYVAEKVQLTFPDSTSR